MSAADVDAYLAELDEPKRSTLQALRETLRILLPDAEECISYGMPAFKVENKVIAGFAAFTSHLSYLPHSGEVLPALSEQIAGYKHTVSSLHFAVDEPLPRELVQALVAEKKRVLARRK